MNYVPKSVLLAVIALSLLANTAEGSVRKCPGAMSVATNSNVPLVTVDGVVVDASTTNLELLDIVDMAVGCVMVEGVKRSGIAIVTRSGAEGVMRSYLTDVVVAQEAYRTNLGQYATTLNSLGFFQSHPQFAGIEMVATDGRWNASMRFDGVETSCHVSWATTPSDGPRPTVEGIACL